VVGDFCGGKKMGLLPLEVRAAHAAWKGPDRSQHA
jgi:hypothetical protein